jgi:hypothetical protein
MTIKIPDFQQSRAIVDKEGRPFADFLRSINQAFRVLVNNANATNAALEAASIANAAATAAMTAATDATTAAATAQLAADSTTEATALANSYVTGITIGATDAGTNATITISAHSRIYAYVPPTTVSVTGGSITGLTYSTTYFIYYDQASRLGGAVTYVTTLNNVDVAQINDRHSVAQITTPAATAPASTGGGVRPPGGVFERFPD